MGAWEVSAGVAALLVVVGGAVLLLRVRADRRAAAERRRREEEVLREEVLGRLRQVLAPWDEQDERAASARASAAGRGPVTPDPPVPGRREGPAHGARRARRGRATPVVRVLAAGVTILVLTALVAAALTWFAGR